MTRELLDSFVSFNNLHLIEESIEKGNGIFFISGHISNWELMAFSYAKVFNTKLNIITKPQSNKLVNKKIKQYRERCGNKIIETGAPIKAIFEKISKNEIICFLVDQSANPIYSVYSEFFGQKVATFSGPFKIALKYNTEVLFCYIIRSQDYKYVVNIEKVDFSDLKGSSDENLQLFTDRINKNFERVISENPEQWLWFHKRFKHIKN